MRSIAKLLFAALGFSVAIGATSGLASASSPFSREAAKECHGTGTCFVTDGGTTINGKWTESPE